MEKPAANTAQLNFILGLKSNVNNNLVFLDDQTIVYPYGTQCVLYNLDQKSQKFLTISDKNKGITALAISPNRFVKHNIIYFKYGLIIKHLRYVVNLS